MNPGGYPFMYPQHPYGWYYPYMHGQDYYNYHNPSMYSQAYASYRQCDSKKLPVTQPEVIKIEEESIPLSPPLVVNQNEDNPKSKLETKTTTRHMHPLKTTRHRVK